MLKWVKLTADGQLVLGRKQRDGDLTILVNGSFGGGTLTFGYEDHEGNFAPFASGAPLTAAAEASIASAEGVELMVDLAGSTTPDINIGIAADFFTAAF